MAKYLCMNTLFNYNWCKWINIKANMIVPKEATRRTIQSMITFNKKRNNATVHMYELICYCNSNDSN